MIIRAQKGRQRHLVGFKVIVGVERRGVMIQLFWMATLVLVAVASMLVVLRRTKLDSLPKCSEVGSPQGC